MTEDRTTTGEVPATDGAGFDEEEEPAPRRTSTIRPVAAAVIAAVPVGGVNLLGSLACGDVSQTDVTCVTALFALYWPVLLIVSGMVAAQFVSGVRGGGILALGAAVGALTWLVFGVSILDAFQLLLFMVLPALLIGYVAGRGVARAVGVFRRRPAPEDEPEESGYRLRGR